ncbi:pentapeptide repeat-containing protein [Peptoniphilus sp. AGMB00490]|uniref:Pentapeptide repeat-containing protein n=1 Tax=Peptoniphilus faecalis TaxID=2731255 RepID=A0A848RA90_9FIRM|nr:pentapeptide repeat-containing protein [Peptoniphilus faecalis]NMW84738.1 pentapeptide repeat-containing protein [Peptoniphilus faecalis]
MDKEKLREILRKHELWLNGDAKGERADLRRANLSRANLRCAILRDADLERTNLVDADLKYANLENADLSRANLRCATLKDADLEGADLEGADLRCANLINADLRRANLTNVELNWCNTQNIIGQKIISVQVDTSRENNLISYWVDLDIWTTGCFQGSLDKLKRSIEETHKDNEFLRNRYYRVIDFILNEVEQDRLVEMED